MRPIIAPTTTSVTCICVCAAGLTGARGGVSGRVAGGSAACLAALEAWGVLVEEAAAVAEKLCSVCQQQRDQGTGDSQRLEHTALPTITAIHFVALEMRVCVCVCA